MGTWGPGSFEIDTAADWIGGVKSLADVAAVLAAAQSDQANTFSADAAERLLAAAECVATMRGRPSPDMSAKDRKRIAAFGEPSAVILRAARLAVGTVLRNSELTELWTEAGAGPFNRSITSLIDRLNSETAPSPGRRSVRPPRTKSRRETLQCCSFCGGEIQREELFSFEVADMSSEASAAMKRGAWCHLACLNERLHPRHLIQNWKFSKEDLEAEMKR